MYSPKIKEDLVPVIFRLGIREGKPMTKVVDQILRQNFKKRGLIDEKKASQKKRPPAKPVVEGIRYSQDYI